MSVILATKDMNSIQPIFQLEIWCILFETGLLKTAEIFVREQEPKARANFQKTTGSDISFLGSHMET